jgi:toxin HigB-1
MILNFAGKETGRIWAGEVSRRLPTEIQSIARRKLRMINNARRLDDLRIPPANRLEARKGNMKGQHSIRINDQWRIFFRWSEAGVAGVGIVDYH